MVEHLICLVLFGLSSGDFSLDYFDGEWDVSFYYIRRSQPDKIKMSGTLSPLAMSKTNAVFKFLLFNSSEPIDFMKKNVEIRSVGKNSIQVSLSSSSNDDDDDEVYEKIIGLKLIETNDILFSTSFVNEKNGSFNLSIPRNEIERGADVYDGYMLIEEKNKFSLKLRKTSFYTNNKISTHFSDVISFFDKKSSYSIDGVEVHLKKMETAFNFGNLPLYILLLGFMGYFLYQSRGVCFEDQREGGGGYRGDRNTNVSPLSSFFSNLFAPSSSSSSPYYYTTTSSSSSESTGMDTRYTYTDYKTTTRITEIVDEEEEEEKKKKADGNNNKVD